MVVPGRRTVWDGVIELTKMAQEQCVDARLWASHLSATLKPFVEFPSTELAEVLVSYICWDNNLPLLWKFLERAMSLNLVSPLVVLALLALRFLFSILSKVNLCFLTNLGSPHVKALIFIVFGFLQSCS